MCRNLQELDQMTSTSAHWTRMNLVATHGRFCTQWLHTILTSLHQRSVQTWHHLWTFCLSFILVNPVQQVYAMS